MQMAQHFEDISIDDILSVAEREHEAHSRFVQVLCINGEEGIDLVYSYQKTADQGYAVHNYRVHGVKPETHIPSVTKFYLVAFPFENERTTCSACRWTISPSISRAASTRSPWISP